MMQKCQGLFFAQLTMETAEVDAWQVAGVA
jgi:hypothetical protein